MPDMVITLDDGTSYTFPWMFVYWPNFASQSLCKAVTTTTTATAIASSTNTNANAVSVIESSTKSTTSDGSSAGGSLKNNHGEEYISNSNNNVGLKSKIESNFGSSKHDEIHTQTLLHDDKDLTDTRTDRKVISNIFIYNIMEAYV